MKLINGLKLIEEDIKNNKDASRLVALGSEENFNSFNRNCPTCGQGISDTLLISQNEKPIMTIEENIVHLKSQKELFKLTIVQKENQIQKLEEKLGRLSSGITTLQSLASSFRADI
ncbi:TPA: hypothetical protein H1547_002886, partial [Listeria monocytogenes]|nr:hypothetical protein [Listeria monocytogenes]